jgi:N-acetylmuramic acid 6-phosphate etherase
MPAPSSPRGHLATEGLLEAARELDRLSTEQALALMQAQDASIHAALAAARPSLVRAIDEISARLARGGRLFYVGAGTSGRLAVLDAAECPPTFQSDPEQVQAVLAGGADALLGAVEGAEDDARAAGAELDRRELTAEDAVLAISAGGTTPFAQGAVAFAKDRGALTLFLACVPFEQAPDTAEISIRIVTGAELIAGSTRLKAGTATKLALNAISTLVMTRLGKVHGNLMVDVNTRGNAKLVERGARIVGALTGLDRARSLELLERAGGQVKLAVVMQRLQLDAGAARSRLSRAGNVLRTALET